MQTTKLRSASEAGLIRWSNPISRWIFKGVQLDHVGYALECAGNYLQSNADSGTGYTKEIRQLFTPSQIASLPAAIVQSCQLVRVAKTASMYVGKTFVLCKPNDEESANGIVWCEPMDAMDGTLVRIEGESEGKLWIKEGWLVDPSWLQEPHELSVALNGDIGTSKDGVKSGAVNVKEATISVPDGVDLVKSDGKDITLQSPLTLSDGKSCTVWWGPHELSYCKVPPLISVSWDSAGHNIQQDLLDIDKSIRDSIGYRPSGPVSYVIPDSMRDITFTNNCKECDSVDLGSVTIELVGCGEQKQWLVPIDNDCVPEGREPLRVVSKPKIGDMVIGPNKAVWKWSERDEMHVPQVILKKIDSDDRDLRNNDHLIPEWLAPGWWIATDKDGQVCIFDRKPHLEIEIDKWYIDGVESSRIRIEYDDYLLRDYINLPWYESRLQQKKR